MNEQNAKQPNQARSVAELLALQKQGGNAKELLAGLSAEELKTLKGQIDGELQQTQEKLYDAEKNLRNIQGQIELAEEDSRRVENVVQITGSQLNATFNKIFKNANAAATAIWQFEQAHGVEAAAEMLRKKPQAFGELCGASMFGFKFGGRALALKLAAKVNYAQLRKDFDQGSELLTKIKRVLGRK